MLTVAVLVASASFAQAAHTVTATYVPPAVSITALQVIQVNATAADSVTLSDAVSFTVGVVPGDSVTMSDQAAMTVGKVVGDSVTMGDSATLTIENLTISGHMLNDRILNG